MSIERVTDEIVLVCKMDVSNEFVTIMLEMYSVLYILLTEKAPIPRISHVDVFIVAKICLNLDARFSHAPKNCLNILKRV